MVKILLAYKTSPVESESRCLSEKLAGVPARANLSSCQSERQSCRVIGNILNYIGIDTKIYRCLLSHVFIEFNYIIHDGCNEQ